METCGFPVNKVKIPQIPTFLQATILHTLKILFSWHTGSIFEVFQGNLKRENGNEKESQSQRPFLDGKRL